MPTLPVTVIFTVFETLFAAEVAVICTVCCEYCPSEPPASLPVMMPVTGSTDAIDGSEEVHVISEVSAASGCTFSIESWISVPSRTVFAPVISKSVTGTPSTTVNVIESFVVN